MSMKAILVPTENHDAMHSALETALLLARRYDSYMEGFALRVPIIEVTGMEMGLALERFAQDSEEEAKKARQIFESSCRTTMCHARLGQRSRCHLAGWMRH